MKTKTAAELGLKRLYHFQDFESPDRLARILADGTIYCANPRNFNDPWDCQPCFGKPALNDPQRYEDCVRWFSAIGRKHGPELTQTEYARREEMLRADRALLERLIDEMTVEMGVTIQEQYRVYCLSTHSDSSLMWSHYGGSHRGVCLEYSVQNELFCGAYKVEYAKAYPAFELDDDTDDANLRLLLTKSDDWSYEDEFRLVATESPYRAPDVPVTKGGVLPLPEGSLLAVIVGCLMSEESREIVRQLIRQSGKKVPLKAADRLPDRYELVIRDLP